MKKKTIITTLPLLSVAVLGGIVETNPTNIVNAQVTKTKKVKPTGKKPPKKPTGKAPSGMKMGIPPNGKGKMGGANTQSYDYKGTLKATVNIASGSKSIGKKTIKNTKSDQNTVLVQKTGKVSLTGTKLIKSGNSKNDDNANFYGLDAILQANGKQAIATVKNAKLMSNATGANGIFATNKGTVKVSDTKITTKGKANSRGLDATYGGKINAKNVTISTKGDYSAAVATDRGGGTVKASDSTVSTKGTGSPLVYSTGSISYKNVNGTATGSQIAGMEGYNLISLENSNLKSTNNKIPGSDPIKNGVIIYQSMSGDAETSVSKGAVFQAKDSTLSTDISSGAMFYLTNTTGRIVLSNTNLNFDSDRVDLLNVSGNNSNNWGTKGKNGATLDFTGTKQTLKGDVVVDTISKLNFYLLNGSNYTGKIKIIANKYATRSTKTKAPSTVNIDKSSKWIVTGNSTITNLNLANGGKVVDSDRNTVTIIANGKTVQKGSSKYTVTVTGNYSTRVTTTKNNQFK